MRPLLLCLLLGLTAASARADEEPPPPPEAGVQVQRIAGARIVGAVLPGRAVGQPAATGDGVVVLVATGEDARALLRFDPAGDGSLVELAGGLAPDFDAAGGLIAGDRLFVPRPRLGRLEAYRWDGTGALAPAGDSSAIDLPVRARRVATGLVLSVPPLHLLERSGQPPRVAVGPEAQGRRRLLTTLIDPADPEAAAEAWTRFSANEKAIRSWYLSLDGRPTLVVAALAADKLGIFEKQKLRVFPLRADRTRSGSPPALEIQTVTRHWYPLGVDVADADLDGRDDLVVVQPDGLGAKKLALEVYRGQGNGGFYLAPRRSVIVAPEARWAYGEDLDGDLVPDLVTVAGDRLQIYRGLAGHKRKALDKTPYRTLEVSDLGTDSDLEIVIRIGGDGHDDDEPTGPDDPRLVDFDGDGRGEILLIGERDGRTLLWVIELE